MSTNVDRKDEVNSMVMDVKCNECKHSSDVMVLVPYDMMATALPQKYPNLCCMDNVKVIICDKCILALAGLVVSDRVLQFVRGKPRLH